MVPEHTLGSVSMPDCIWFLAIRNAIANINLEAGKNILNVVIFFDFL